MRKRRSRPPGPNDAPLSERGAPDSTPPSSTSSDPFSLALRAAAKEPEREESWDAVEEQAHQLERPDEVAALYRDVLTRPLPAELVARLGQRAVRFHDEWFEDAGPLSHVLTRVLEVDPTAQWAFERLVMLFTVTSKWDELLALYDRSLALEKERGRRMQLLDEAAHVAKDFAAQPDRAIGYLQQLLPLRPTDAQLATSLERLFERQKRHRDLIDLWNLRLAVLPRDGKLAMRARIAGAWLDKLDQPDEALAAVEALIPDDPHDTYVCKILERIVVAKKTSPDVRRRSIALLKQRYSTAKKGNDVVRVLRIALDTEDRAEQIAVHREIAERLAELGKPEEAIDHAASVVVLDCGSMPARERLRELAAQTGRNDRYAEALATAVDACADPAMRLSLLVEAARVRGEVLGDEPEAIALYARALAEPAEEPAVVLDVARRLVVLLEGAGRAREQLEVLERLSLLEPDEAARRTALGRAARLSDRLGEPDRALAAWNLRLASDAADVEALDATIELLDRLERWPALIDSLQRRVAALSDDEGKRRDLTRIARVQSERLRTLPEAIATWNQVEATFGPDAESVDALSTLLGESGAYAEVAKLLSSAADREREPARRADLLHRLGDVHRERLSALGRAVECYARALEVEPKHQGARAGLLALLDDRVDDATDVTAAEALAAAYKATDEWTKTLEILEHRLGFAKDDASRTAILLEAASIEETRAGDVAAALASVCRAFPLSPADPSIERELLRLATATNEWTQVVEGYKRAIKTAASDPTRVSSLRLQQGSILEVQLGDAAAALTAYTPVLVTFPDSMEAAEAIVRVGGRTGEWDVAARALVDSARARGRVEYTLISSVELIATSAGSWDAAALSMASAIARTADLPPRIARELETQLALWHRDRRNDPDAAELALVRAVGHDGADAETLRMLAVLQRRAPGPALLDTLLRLADATDDDLGVLFEAAGVALDDQRDVARGTEILARLLRGASSRWTAQHSLPTLPPHSVPQSYRKGTEPAGTPTAESLSAWALERLVEIHVAQKNWPEAIELLVEYAALPFPPDSSRELRHRAASIAGNDLGDFARAIELYRALLDERPDDRRAIAALSTLYREHQRLPELVALLRHDLELTTDEAARLSLRLDLSTVLGSVGDRDGRLESLRENLAERPGHEPSISALTEMLESEASHDKLANVLSEQALQLESSGEAARSAVLWARVARIAEDQLGDLSRALESLRRVVTLGVTLEALDSLARLHAARGENAIAVEWLEKRLARTPAEERAPTVVRLSREHLAMGARDRAIATLTQALEADPAAKEVRDLLASIRREAGEWDALATLLTDGVTHARDAATRLSYLRESAEIYQRRTGDPTRAIPLLEEATRLAPQDRTVRTSLAEALRIAGRLDEARAMLEHIVEEYGRRRPPERALVHVQLAQVAEAKEDLPGALAQLELASAMDMGHVPTLRMLGALARRAGELARAERAYRALLILVRRPAAALEAGMGPSEILFELYRIATDLQQPDRARETLESAFDAASQHDDDAKRLVDALRTHGERELLLRALQARLATVEDPTLVAEVLAEISQVSEGLGRVDDAMDAVFKALDQMPSSAPLHDAARSLATRNGLTPRYADFTEDLGERALGNGEPKIAGALFFRLGELYEHEVSDLERAAEAYRRVESTGERQLDAWRALDRVFGALGKSEEQGRVLHSLVQALGEDDGAGKTEALYRLAAIELASEATRDDAIEMLSWAIDRDPQLDRAAMMLRRGAADHHKGVVLYERVARATGDAAMLLDALEHRAKLGDLGTDALREAVDLSSKSGDGARTEALLQRAIELARAAESPADSVWALVALAERRKTSEDFRGAVTFLREASTAAGESGEALTLCLEAAALAAGPAEDLPLAAQLYEQLRARDPGDRNVWGPLLEVHRCLGDRARIESLIAETVDSVFDASERNVLRVERARLLLDEPGRESEAVAALREILDEDPEHREATALLMDVLEKQGKSDELADLLARQLDAARARSDREQIVALSLRIGALLEGTRRDEAMDVYRQASHQVPDDKPLLEALVRLQQPTDDENDRADTMERLLALEHGDRAAALSLELVKLRESLEDEEGVVRALERGFREVPGNEKIRARLEKFLGDRQQWGKLAEVIAFDGAARKDKRSATGRLREAAKIHTEKLADPRAAARALKQAREIAPDDVALLTDLAKTLAAAGEPQMAVAELGHALDETRFGDAVRSTLLRLRAELRAAIDDDAGAIDDLEAAHTISGKAVAPELAAALDRRRQSAAKKREGDAERASTLRLVEVLASAGEGIRAHEVLLEWVTRKPDDRAALRMLAEMDGAAGRWEGVVEAYRRLVAIEKGDEQVDAALRLADACAHAGTPDAAREGLELAFRSTPSSEPLRASLRKIYAQIGAHAELAALSLAEAEHAKDDATRFDRLLEAGDLFLQAGDLTASIDPLERALKLKPLHHEATVLLADSYTVNGQIEEAMQLLNPAIAAHKGRRSREVAALMHRMARAANAGGGHDVELQWLQKALDADMQNGQVASELAEVAMELKHWDIALKALKAVTLLKVPGPMSKAMANLKQGMIALQQGDQKRAVVLAKTALAQDPKLTEAAEFLRKMSAG